MKICFISHTSRLGGAERVLLETIALLHRMNVESCVLVPAEGELSRKLRDLGVPYELVRNSSWVTWEQPTLWTRLKAILPIGLGILATLPKIIQSGCDIVYSNTLTICNGAVVAAILRIPHVWHLHDFPGYHGIQFYYGRRISFRLIDLLSSACITVSEHLSLLCASYIAPAKLTRIYPPMTMVTAPTESVAVVDEALGEKRPLRCVIVGGLVPTKGQEDAVCALGLLCDEGLNVELFIVGGGGRVYRDRLEQIAASHGVLDRTRFVGMVDNAMPWMKVSDVALVCSTQETFGRVTIEAMLAGLPVIGARAGATTELIRHGENGLLYEPGKPADLALQIKTLFDTPGLAERLRRCGQSQARNNFTEIRYAYELMAVLRRVIQRPTRYDYAPISTTDVASGNCPSRNHTSLKNRAGLLPEEPISRR
jgi:glycosyltransferase involved in cell wall biosynthesis